MKGLFGILIIVLASCMTQKKAYRLFNEQYDMAVKYSRITDSLIDEVDSDIKDTTKPIHDYDAALVKLGKATYFNGLASKALDSAVYLDNKYFSKSKKK